MDEPDDFRIAARAALAAPTTEVLVCALTALWLTRGHLFPVGLLLAAAGFGAGVALAFAVAEALRARRGRVAGALAVALASPLAPLGGEFARAMGNGWQVAVATDEALAVFRGTDPSDHLALAGVAALLHAPLVVLRPGARLTSEIGVMLAGALALIVVVLALETPATGLSVHGLVLAVALRALLFPVFLRGGDRLVDRVLRAERAVAAPTPRRRVQAIATVALAAAVLGIVAGTRDRGLAEARLRIRTELRGDAATLFEAATAGDLAPVASASWTPAVFLAGPPSSRAFSDPQAAASHAKAHTQERRRDVLGLLARAGEQGHLPSMLHAARLLWDEQTPGDAREQQRAGLVWMRRAAATGDPRVMQQLASKLRHVEWWSRSPEEERDELDEAERWLRTAAAAQHLPSMADLANALWYGTRSRRPADAVRRARERAEALRWYRALAELGDVRSASELLNGLLVLPGERLAADDRWLADDMRRVASSPALRRLLPRFDVPAGWPTSGGLVAMQAGRLDEGRAIAEAILRADPHDPWANDAMAYHFLARGLAGREISESSVKAARSYVERARARHLEHAPTRVLLAVCDALHALIAQDSTRDHRARSAVIDLLLAKYLDASLAPMVDEVLMAHAAVEDLPARGLAKQPSLSRAVGRLAQEYAHAASGAVEEGDFARTVTLTTEALRLGAPDGTSRVVSVNELLAARYEALLPLGELERAEADLDAMIVHDAGGEAHLHRGCLRVLRGARDAGLADLRRALELDRVRVPARCWLAALTGEDLTWVSRAAAALRSNASYSGRREAEVPAELGRARELVAVGMEPDRACCLAGVEAERRGDLATARRAYEQAATLPRAGIDGAWARARLRALGE